MKSQSDEVQEELDEYQRELRDRANRSLQRLCNVLQEKPITEKAFSSENTEEMTHRSSEGTVSRQETELERSWSELKQSDAVNQLRLLIRQKEKEAKFATSPSRQKTTRMKDAKSPSADVPAVEDVIPIIHSQSQYIQHLEAEVRFCKTELSDMKQRIMVVVREELKSKPTEDAQKDSTITNHESKIIQNNVPVTSESTHAYISQSPQAISSTAEFTKWQMELEKLNLLYQAKTEVYEAQVISLRKDLAISQKDCEDLKGRLRHQESRNSLSNGRLVSGLCVKCAQHEAVLAQTHTNVHMQAIERLTRERDELMSVLSSLRSDLNEVQQRELNAFQQVKQAVEMAEEANLEKTKAMFQCEQLRNEIARQRERLDKELAVEQEKIARARDEVKEEMEKDKQTLKATAMHLSEKVASLESQTERLTREKDSLASQLEDAQKRCISQQDDTVKVCSELRHQLNQLQMQRDEAEKNLRECRSQNTRDLELRDQEIEKLSLEISKIKKRLDSAQQDAAQAKNESLRLTELLGRAEHQLHLTRLEKETALRCRSDDVKALTFQAQLCEQELTQKIQQMEAQHDKNVQECGVVLKSQNELIGKLKTECQNLESTLERITEKNRLEIDKLSQENKNLKATLGRCQKDKGEMEEQCIQHGKMHERMKKRLLQLDKHCNSSSQHVMELLKSRMSFSEKGMPLLRRCNT
uniref:SHH signaling and ciliogenesis regulator sdccag8 n=1 Tax=Erpetoichthys calabaricus TaxID=27687 RepID=A0A8C4XC44_ERPCA